MKRTTGPDAVPNLFGAGKDGFRDDEPPLPATVVGADFMNAIQEELCAIVEEAGETLDPDDNGQCAGVIGALRTRVGALETDSTSQDGRLDALEADSTSQDGRLDTLEATAMNHGGRITTIEGFNLSSRIVSDEWTYPTPKLKSVRVSLLYVLGTDGAFFNWRFDGTKWSGGGSSVEKILFPIDHLVHTGDVVKSITLLSTPGAERDPGSRMSIALYGAGGQIAIKEVDETDHSGDLVSTVMDGVAHAGINHTVNRAPSAVGALGYYLLVSSGDNDGSGWLEDQVNGIEMTISIPGPRSV